MARENTTARWWRWHRWLAWIVGFQVVAWIVGGALFAWLPFQGWVKSGDAVAKPALTWPVGWATSLAQAAPHLPADANITGIAAVATTHGTAWQVKRKGQSDLWLTMDGQLLQPPDEAAVRRFATSLYQGSGTLQTVSRLETVPRRLGIVQEVGSRRALWLATFNDPLRTRLYVDGVSGQLLATRNEAWVWFDFFWRLHVMDYSDGEDFNNPLMRAASLAALALVASGGVLLALSVRRARRRR